MKASYKVFANNILEGLKPEEAAVAAGYSPKTARYQAIRMMKHPEVSAIIAEYQKKAAEKACVTAEYIIKGLIENAELARIAKQYGASTSALGLLGKHLALFVDRSEVTVTGETMQFLEAVIAIIDQEVKSAKEKGAIAARIAKLQDSLKQ